MTDSDQGAFEDSTCEPRTLDPKARSIEYKSSQCASAGHFKPTRTSDPTMRALHLPAVPAGTQSPFRFPDHPPSPSDLQYTPSTYPEPSSSHLNSTAQPVYLVRVLTTALTRGELSWQEILDSSRFHPYGSAIPGHDIVGIVEKTYLASATTAPKFSPGDRVWGLLDFDRDGAASSLCIAFESELSLAPHPPPGVSLSRAKWDEELATLPLSGLTAYQALFTHGNLSTTTLVSKPSSAPPTLPPPPPPPPQSPPVPPKRVLITGASGSVGIPTIQLAKAAGFHIVATCSASSRSFIDEILTSPSCDHRIIDYTATEYTSIPSTFQTQGFKPVDLVVDCVGGTTLQSILLQPSSVVRPHGRIITIVAPIHTFGPFLSAQMGQACTAAAVDAVDFFVVKSRAEDLAVLGNLVEQGRLRGHVDAVFDLDHGREAMELVESRGRRRVGKVVLRVAES
ncbi:hypothetical protein KCU88_g6607, partial [Aureobasidium melanogenum]